MASPQRGQFTRRQFCQVATAASAAGLGLASRPLLAGNSTVPIITGVDGHQYRVDHDWAKLPEKYTWQTTHNVAIGSDGVVYVIHEGRLDQADHPAIFVFDPSGKYIRSFGSEFQGGGHGIEVRREDGEDFLYVCAYQQQRSIAKLTPTGETLWRQGAPMDSGIYHEAEKTFPVKEGNPWGRDRFLPTNIAFAEDGGFFLADGYGAFRIHRYDTEGNWVSMFGKPSDDEKRNGEFHTPHGIWIDKRGDVPLIVVADRANGRLQWFTYEGVHQQTLDGFFLPANIDTYGDLMVVPDLYGRVTLLGKENQVIAQLCNDEPRVRKNQKETGGFQIRGDESMWQDGRFIHPHDACFDDEGNIFVAEWVQRGRVTKLTKVG